MLTEQIDRPAMSAVESFVEHANRSAVTGELR